MVVPNVDPGTKFCSTKVFERGLFHVTKIGKFSILLDFSRLVIDQGGSEKYDLSTAVKSGAESGIFLF